MAHYSVLAAGMHGAARPFRRGAFGENLVFDGARETDIGLNDQWRLGDLLQRLSA